MQPLPVTNPVRGNVQHHHTARQPDPLAPHERHQHDDQRIKDRQADEERLEGNLWERRIGMEPAADQVKKVSAGAFEEADQVHRENPSRPQRLPDPPFPQLNPHQATLDKPFTP